MFTNVKGDLKSSWTFFLFNSVFLSFYFYGRVAYS